MRKRKIVIAAFIVLAAVFFICGAARFASADPKLKTYVESVEKTKEGMTVWELVKSGGALMWVLALLSVAGVALIFYESATFKISVQAPRAFSEDVIKKLEQKKAKDAERACQSEQNIIAKIVMAGINKRPKGVVYAREAMENSLNREIGLLWQNVGYLSDIATIAPLVGLLGTILGMIQAFNGIAFQTAVVKPILIAGGVSKAMVTTAGGLLIAIPAQAFYTYFKARLNEITNTVESYASDIIRLIEGL